MLYAFFERGVDLSKASWLRPKSQGNSDMHEATSHLKRSSCSETELPYLMMDIHPADLWMFDGLCDEFTDLNLQALQCLNVQVATITPDELYGNYRFDGGVQVEHREDLSCTAFGQNELYGTITIKNIGSSNNCSVSVNITDYQNSSFLVYIFTELWKTLSQTTVLSSTEITNLGWEKL